MGKLWNLVTIFGITVRNAFKKVLTCLVLVTGEVRCKISRLGILSVSWISTFNVRCHVIAERCHLICFTINFTSCYWLSSQVNSKFWFCCIFSEIYQNCISICQFRVLKNAQVLKFLVARYSKCNLKLNTQKLKSSKLKDDIL